jgi:2-oxoisovalerate dehydrogenase E1 component beta subunit
MSVVTYLEAIRQALWEEMESDPRVFLLGQDVGTYGGPFRVTAGMLDRFGPERIVDTPISESAMVGAAIGAALMGLRPVVEMQFIDFISCAFNQIVNFAGPNRYRWGEKVPIVIRGPAGGNVHGSAFHSQNPESYFQHTPGLKIVAPATVADAYGLLKAAIRDPNPVLFFEHKYLYRRIKDELPGEAARDAAASAARAEAADVGTATANVDAVTESAPRTALAAPSNAGLVPIGKARLARAGTDLSVITYGAMLHVALEAAERLEAEGIDLEVLDLRTVKPLDEEAILATVRKTNKALVLTEEQQTGSVAGEVAARIAERAFAWLDGPVHRLCCPDTPVPYSPTLEEAYLPNTEKLVARVRELASY